MNIFYIFALLIIFTHTISAQDEGMLNYQNQNYKVAEEYYEYILKNDEDNSKAHFGKGSSLYMQNDLKNAEINFNESLTASDEILQSKAYFNLGNISYKNNKLDDALQFYKKALELNPNDDEARFNYEYIKYQKKPEEKKDEDKKDEDKKDEDKKDEDKKGDEESADEEQSQQQPQDEKKSQDLKKAESILNALKNDEKVMQKKQLQKFKTKKLLKDW